MACVDNISPQRWNQIQFELTLTMKFDEHISAPLRAFERVTGCMTFVASEWSVTPLFE
jgi:hypothetical protein